MAGFDAIGETAIGELASGSAIVLVPTFDVSVLVDLPAVLAGARVSVPGALLPLSDFAPIIVGGGSIAVPFVAIIVASAAPRVSVGSTNRVPVTDLGISAFAPSIVGGGGVAVPSVTIGLSAAAPLVSGGAMVDVPAVTLTLSVSVPSINPGVWIHPPTAGIRVVTTVPRVQDVAASILVEERRFLPGGDAIAEGAIAETPDDTVITRIPTFRVSAPSPKVGGGVRLIVPGVTITLSTHAPAALGRPRRPTIQLIAS